MLSPVNDDRLKAALTYAARGWYTFPAPPDGSKKSLKAALYSKTAEHPDGAPWGKTRAEAEIRADWQRWPDANIGLPTGAASGFIVIEADTMEGHQVDGLASLRKLEAEHGKLPDTRTTVSPSGSPHLYFKHPGVGIKIRSAPLDQVNFPGIDVKGDGGMVLAPPSVRPGKGEYKVVNDLPLADLPQWLLDLLLAASHRPASAARAPGDKPSPTAQQVLAAVAVTPNDGEGGWEAWNNYGMAIFAATDGSDDGEDIFHAWSKKLEDKYDRTDTATKWQAFHACPPKVITVGSVFFAANEACPAWRTFVREREGTIEAQMAAVVEEFSAVRRQDQGDQQAPCAGHRWHQGGRDEVRLQGQLSTAAAGSLQAVAQEPAAGAGGQEASPDRRLLAQPP